MDLLFYSLFSFAHVWMGLAFVLLFARRKKFRQAPSHPERRLYQAVIGGCLVVWAWNGVRPSPMLFGDRAGLYWGMKSENATWRPHTDGFRGAAKISRTGGSCMAVSFGKMAGSIIFHHFPNAPPLERYEAVEFYLRRHDLKRDSVRVTSYSDGKVRHPSAGLELGENYRCTPGAEAADWVCYRVPFAEFGHPGGGLVGIAFGKGNGVDEGTFYLDDIRLIRKGGI